MSNKPTLGQAKHTLEIFDQQDISADEMRILHDGILSDFLEGVRVSRYWCLPTRDELRMFLGLLPLKPTLLVNYSLFPSSEMIVAGKYDYVRGGGHLELFERVRAGKGVRRVGIKLATILEGHVNLDENEAGTMFGTHWRLAAYEELFAFGATFPKVQLRCPHGIFGKSYKKLDSRGFPQRFHPNLWGSKEHGRCLAMEAGGTYCNPGTHFLFVEK